MIDLLEFKFLTPFWLMALPIAWWLVWMFTRHQGRESMWQRVCDPRLLDYMWHGRRAEQNQRQFSWPLLVVITLMIIAAAGPSWRQQAPQGLTSAKARLIALDLSQSMFVSDIDPNRFQQAKAVTREILQAEFDGETGLIVFAGDAFVVSPLSRDAKLLLALLDALEPGLLPVDGTRIDHAIVLARDLLGSALSASSQIIVVTAGASVTGNAVAAARLAQQQGQQVSVVAVGSATGAPQVNAAGGLNRDQQDRFILSKTNFLLLEQIATAGGGVLVTLDNSRPNADMQRLRVQAQILIESAQLANEQDYRAVDDGIWLLWLVLPGALLLFRRNLLWTILLLVIVPLEQDIQASESQSVWRHPEQKAYAAYISGNYQRALKLSANPLLRGSAHYRIGQFDAALEQFQLDDSAQSFFNRGNTYVRLQRFTAAINAFTEAIKRDPEQQSAKINKRLIEIYLQRQTGEEDASSPDNTSDNASEADASELAARDPQQNQPSVSSLGSSNPADQQQSGSGLGASLSDAEIDPMEQFDGREQSLLRKTPDENLAELAQQARVERWIEKLPATSTELYRRKFLRDYQRRQRTER